MRHIRRCAGWSLILGFIFAVACGGDNSAEGVAEEFLYRYFIELDQEHALELSSGLAEEKLREEMELLRGIRNDPNLDLSEHRPFIEYELVERRSRDVGQEAFIYKIAISSKGGGKHFRQIVLTTTRVNGAWKVQNFDTFPWDNP